MLRFFGKTVAIIAAVALLSGCAEVDDYVRDFKQTTTITEKKTSKSIKRSANTKLVSSRSWYDLAKAEAVQWSADALLAGAVGDSESKDGTSLTIDGLTDQWSYQFISLQNKKKLRLFVINGRISSKTIDDLALDTDADMTDYKGLLSDDQWKIDSDKAAEIAGQEYAKRFPEREPTSASYVMFNLKKHTIADDSYLPMMVWTLSYETDDPVKISVNAVTGEVIAD